MSTPRFLTLPPGTRPRRLTTGRGELAGLDTAPAAGTPARRTAVLVPGFTGSKEDFLPILRRLAGAGHRVVALDQRGQYESVGPDDAQAYDIDSLGADVLDVVAALDAGPVHLLGHSFGGLVARAAAICRPAALCSLTLLGSGPGPVSGSEAERARLLAEALQVWDLPQIWEAMRAMEEAAGDRVALPEAVDAFLHRRWLANNPTGVLTMVRQLLHTPDRVDALRATGVPVLVAYGESDYVWTPAEQAAMARRLGARLKEIPAAAHSPAVEAPDRTADLLLDFWALVEGR
jgi:pimeloyl-ACP methyl ester carboxylesterase